MMQPIIECSILLQVLRITDLEDKMHINIFSPRTKVAMTKPFKQCSLPDLVTEIFLAARAACSALDAAAAAQLLPCFSSAEASEAALQRHPLVRGTSGLECTGTAESRQAWCSMLGDLFSAAAISVSDAARLRVYIVCKECAKRGRVRTCVFIARVAAHPSLSLADDALLAQLVAHPVRCLASQLNVQRMRTMFRCRTPSQAHWHAIDVGLQQRRAVLCGGALLCVLVPRLLCFQGECNVRSPLNLAKFILSRNHSIGSEGLFEEGQRLYREQRFSEAAERWGRAALLQHAPSHAHAANMLCYGRPGLPKDLKRAFQFMSAGAALGCAHSKGLLGRCYVWGFGTAQDLTRGLALGRESEAAGSCFGQFAVGWCYRRGWGVVQDDQEAVRLWRLAAAQGHAVAQNNVAAMCREGKVIAQDFAEAVRLYSLAAAQGHADACNALGCMFEKGQGAEQNDAEAVRLYRLAAAQGHTDACNSLGKMFETGRGVAPNTEEAIRLYRLAAAQRHQAARANLRRLGAM
jgi:TPR repeat protein